MAGMAMNPQFWQGKRVFLTGHTGFKGSWLSAWLSCMGASVTGFALPPATQPNLFGILLPELDITSIMGDIRDKQAVLKATQQAQPEIIMHLAAQPLVRASYSEPIETYMTNVMGTVHVLEAAKQISSLQSVLVITTDKCYENQEFDWGYRETDRLGGHDPYSASKACAELVSASYEKAFLRDNGVKLATARAGNVIGGGDWSPDRLLCDIVRAFSSGQPVSLRYPHSVRPWQHVLDALSGYLHLVEYLSEDTTPAVAEPWNFGPLEPQHKTVYEVAQFCASVWGPPAEVKQAPEPGSPHETHYLTLDASKAHRKLGWSPRLSTQDALNWTMQWYQAYYQQADMGHWTMQQIQNYMGLHAPLSLVGSSQ